MSGELVGLIEKLLELSVALVLKLIIVFGIDVTEASDVRGCKLEFVLSIHLEIT